MNNIVPARPGMGVARFTQDQIELIKRTICKGATNDELQLFLYQADKTGLDPLARQIYSVERRERRGEQWVTVRSIQTSIDGFRLIAERSGKYAGQIGPEWCGRDGVWCEVWLKNEPPAAARVGVLRSDFKEPCYGVARYDAYAQKKSGGEPTAMWAKMADVMLAKCAESLALRKAFPQELSGVYTSEEMDQAASEPQDITPPRPALVAPVEPPHDPETGEIAPHTIPLPFADDGRPDYLTWGRLFIAAVKSATDQGELSAWCETNRVSIERSAEAAPKVHRSVVGAMDARRAQLPEPEMLVADDVVEVLSAAQ